MRILIIEDEKPAAEKLERMILRYDPSITVLGKLRSVEASLEWLRNNPPPDLLFMDIQLLDGTSFDILKERSISCPVIFTTAYDHYAIEAFKLHSIDYLLKPIPFEKLSQAFRKYHELKQTFVQQQQQEQIDRLLQATIEQDETNYKTRFLVKSGSRIFSISIQNIAYFFSEDKISFLVKKDGKKYAINQTLDDLEKLLNPRQFFRINRQMIIHIESIRVVHSFFKGRLKIDLKPPSGIDSMVSSRRANKFKEWLDQ